MFSLPGLQVECVRLLPVLRQSFRSNVSDGCFGPLHLLHTAMKPPQPRGNAHLHDRAPLGWTLSSRSPAVCLPRPASATACHVGSAVGLLDTLRHLLPTAQDWAPLWDSRAPTAARGPAAVALYARHPAGAWPVSELQLFTDGSFKGPGRLSWAVTVFERCTDGYCEWQNFLGSFSGTLDAWEARGLCAAEDNIDAESVAFCAATLWALSCPDTVQLSIWTDCQSVLQVATGSADCQRQGPTSRLLGRCRCLWQAL